MSSACHHHDHHHKDEDDQDEDDDDDDDLYIIGAVCLSVRHKSDYFRAELIYI